MLQAPVLKMPVTGYFVVLKLAAWDPDSGSIPGECEDTGSLTQHAYRGDPLWNDYVGMGGGSCLRAGQLGGLASTGRPWLPTVRG